MGQGVARDLIKQEQIKKVVLGDINTDPGRLQDKLRASEKVSLSRIDVNDHGGMVSAIKEVDVVINCAGPFYKTAVAVARAAVEAKVNYIDICDDYEAADILFASDIDQAAKEAGITVLTGMGSDPGTNNVIVKWYANQLDRVDEIDLFWVVSIAELAGAAWDHSLHMTIGKIPQYLEVSWNMWKGVPVRRRPNSLNPWRLSGSLCGTSSTLTIPRYIKGYEGWSSKGH